MSGRRTVPGLRTLPPPLRARVAGDWERLCAAAAARRIRLPAGDWFDRSLARVWAGSRFVAENCIREPELLRWLDRAGRITRPAAEAAPPVPAGAETADLMVRLRRWRRWRAVRIAWRDLAGWAPLEETLAELSALADGLVRETLAQLHRAQARRLGSPRRADGRRQTLVTLALGKLGANELNFSSDIDLIFAYPEDGRIERSGEEIRGFFTRLAQRLVDCLQRPTAEGFVYRVDTRLRPFGNAGPLVAGFDALEDYYLEQGRPWERFALTKARPLTGLRRDQAALMDQLLPFVYRRHLDYEALAELREIKSWIEQAVRREGAEDDIKRGPGGIRELEFVVQSMQLVHGGRRPELRGGGPMRLLPVLRDHRLLPAHASRQLLAAYRFLRRTENHLQAWADEQVHRLPTAEEDRQRLAFTLGFRHWEDFRATLDRHRQRVAEQFAQFVGHDRDSGLAPRQQAPAPIQALWTSPAPDAAQIERLRSLGFDQPERRLRQWQTWREGLERGVAGERGRRYLHQLMPLLLAAAAATEDPATTFDRLLGVIEALVGRTSYLALLVENPLALSRLVRLSAASRWVAASIARQPALLDELLDGRTLYAPVTREALAQALAGRLANLSRDDLEGRMDALRRFRQAAVLRVAAADIGGRLEVVQVAARLSDIAEVILPPVLDMAWQHLVARHGEPRGRRGRRVRFAIVAYGRLGSRELGYGSDLDLVFLHDGDDPERPTRGGPQPIPQRLFFTRLGQRIVHLLTARTPAGILYPVDTRLRPSGQSGLLVSSLAGFAEYQRTQAWTWEHQALVRARAVAGDRTLGQAFGRIRREILCRARDPDRLRAEILAMRERMRRHLDRPGAGLFHLKQGRGGIADIEFMVQYGLLERGHAVPDLVRHTDNLSLLGSLAAAGFLPERDAASLRGAYLAYVAEVNRLALQDRPPLVAEGAFRAQRRQVTAIWRRLLEARPGPAPAGTGRH